MVKSYLFDRKQLVSINSHVSNKVFVKSGVPQGSVLGLNKASVKYGGVPQSSVLGPLLFLVYINDLNDTIEFCKVHHFADSINLVRFSKSVKNSKLQLAISN